MHNSLLEKYKINFLSDIIGQPYNISFLQNSFFKEIFYPLYIFSGMRGTGKTTSARLFSYGMQCNHLENLKKDVTNKVPCYNCDSCILHKKREHPDLIEIDAASHSGIDTIRAVIDNVYMLPIVSKKKIYIIDEAHMLSKAAFNACLKIMEEPPKNVHFLLATTELNKIIETVRSRSIILHYNPILIDDLEKYLEEICIKEKIIYEKESLKIISKASEGSVRDALNLMNKLIIKCNNITEDIVLHELGFIKEEIIISLIDSILNNDQNLYYEQKKYLLINKEIHKKRFFEDVVVKIQQSIFLLKNNNDNNNDKLTKLHFLLDLFYYYEENFYLTNTFHGLIDIIFFKLNNKYDPSIMSAPQKNMQNKINTLPKKEISHQNQNKENIIAETNNNTETKNHNIFNNNENNEEEQKKNFFLHLDKVLSTILQKGKCIVCPQNQLVTIILKKNFTFYNNYFIQQENSIMKALQSSFGDNWKIKYNFTLIEEPIPDNQMQQKLLNNEKKSENNITNQNKNIFQENNIKRNQNKKESQVDSNVPEFINKINEKFPGKTYLYH